VTRDGDKREETRQGVGSLSAVRRVLASLPGDGHADDDDAEPAPSYPVPTRSSSCALRERRHAVKHDAPSRPPPPSAPVNISELL